jgi:hypothetical protein
MLIESLLVWGFFPISNCLMVILTDSKFLEILLVGAD